MPLILIEASPAISGLGGITYHPTSTLSTTTKEEEETSMKFYTQTHQHYCGIDLHARCLYVWILDQDGTILIHKEHQG